MNRAILIGNLTRDPEKRTTPNDLSVTTFTVAVQRRVARGEQKADFLNIVTWRGLADNCAKYLSKGSKVVVVGRIETRQYDDKDGIRRYVTEIIADEVEFLSRPKDQADGGSGYAPPQDSGRSGRAPQDNPAYSTAQDYGQLNLDDYSTFVPVEDSELPF